MIKLLGYDSQPYPRLQLEFTNEDIDVIEWLRGRTYIIPAIAETEYEISTDRPQTEFGKITRKFLDRLWEATGHIRCCADPSRNLTSK